MATKDRNPLTDSHFYPLLPQSPKNANERIELTATDYYPRCHIEFSSLRS